LAGILLGVREELGKRKREKARLKKGFGYSSIS